MKDLRPISLLPALSKVLEKIISTQLSEHVNKHNFLPVTQSGFRAGYSCTTAMLNVTDDILSASDRGCVTALVLLDYSKAFDTVNHMVLTTILRYTGANDNAVSFISDYLSGRTQVVKLDDNTTSKPIPVTQGVPQGSILGPLLFSIYTSVFMKHIKFCKVHIYADDTQLYHSFNPSNWERAMTEINTDLQYIFDASVQHSLKINPDKSAVILFGNKNACDNLVNQFNISINGVQIPISNKAKSLGLIIDNTFRYRDQISKYICQSYQNLKKLYPHRSYLNIHIKNEYAKHMYYRILITALLFITLLLIV